MFQFSSPLISLMVTSVQTIYPSFCFFFNNPRANLKVNCLRLIRLKHSLYVFRSLSPKYLSELWSLIIFLSILITILLHHWGTICVILDTWVSCPSLYHQSLLPPQYIVLALGPRHRSRDIFLFASQTVRKKHATFHVGMGFISEAIRNASLPFDQKEKRKEREVLSIKNENEVGRELPAAQIAPSMMSESSNLNLLWIIGSSSVRWLIMAIKVWEVLLV